MQFDERSKPEPPTSGFDAPGDSSAGDSDGSFATADEVRRLARRVTRIEAQQSALPKPANTSTQPGGRTPAAIASTDPDLSRLASRIASLEQAQANAQEKAKGLADPDAIPSTLAVLLASRGVITKPGDIEALQANMTTFGMVVADESATDWDRIEAYRGMLTFGFDSPDACVAAMPHLVDLLLTSRDAKARHSAAVMLQVYKNPSIAGKLMAAFEREDNATARAEIIGAMLQLAGDPGIRQTLRAAQKRKLNTALQKRIRSALDK